MRIKLIVNPVAGQGRINRYLLRIKEILGRDNSFSLEFTTAKRDSFHIAYQSAKSNCDIIVACGGDGTVHEVVNGVVSSGVSVPLGFIPVGASNACALSLGIPTNPLEACEVILQKKTRRIDLGKTTNGRISHFFLSMAGIGFDAQATYLVKPVLKMVFGGIPAHLLAGTYGLLRYERTKFLLKIDGCEYEGYQALIFNGKYYGAALKAGICAEMSDGYLDLYLFKQKKRRDFLRYVLGVVNGSYTNFRDVEYFRIKELKTYSVEKTWVQLDGEVIGTLPQEIEVHPQGLEVIAP